MLGNPVVRFFPPRWCFPPQATTSAIATLASKRGCCSPCITFPKVWLEALHWSARVSLRMAMTFLSFKKTTGDLEATESWRVTYSITLLPRTKAIPEPLPCSSPAFPWQAPSQVYFHPHGNGPDSTENLSLDQNEPWPPRGEKFSLRLFSVLDPQVSQLIFPQEKAHSHPEVWLFTITLATIIPNSNICTFLKFIMI